MSKPVCASVSVERGELVHMCVQCEPVDSDIELMHSHSLLCTAMWKTCGSREVFIHELVCLSNVGANGCLKFCKRTHAFVWAQVPVQKNGAWSAIDVLMKREQMCF